MKQSWWNAAWALMLLTPRAMTGPGEVTGVSVLPGAGNAQVVIDVRGSVSVQDYTLTDPARIVVDIVGARLNAPGTLYDGRNRGGIVQIRYAQFRPDVVRVVLQLESMKTYRVERGDDAVRIAFGTDHAFSAWSSMTPLAASTPGSAVGSAPALADAPPPVRASVPVAAAPSAVPAPPPATRDVPAAVPAGVLERPLRAAPVVQGRQVSNITVTFDSALVSDVIANFAAFSGKTIILGKDVRGFVTAEIKNQPWDVAFQAILEAQGLAAEEYPPGVIRVQSSSALAARDSLEPLRTTLVPVNFARASSMAYSVKSFVSKRGQVVADTATNTLIITDVESRIQGARDFVSQLDVPTPQVSIQAKLIFVDRTDIENLGVRYDLGTAEQFFNKLVQRPDPSSLQGVDTDGDGVPDRFVAKNFFTPDQNIINLGGNALSAIANAEEIIPSPALKLVFSTAIGNFNLTSFVEALQQVQLADLQAEPLISTADNSKASILVGERTPIRQIDVSAATAGQTGPPRAVTTIVPTGIKLEVTPHVTNNGQVFMTIHAENSAIRAAPADVGFTFQTQESDNQLLVSDGETAVIGGLTVTNITVSKSGIPFLVDLPIVGRIFGFTQRREQRRDLLILVTPHIVKNPSAAAPGGE